MFEWLKQYFGPVPKKEVEVKPEVKAEEVPPLPEKNPRRKKKETEYNTEPNIKAITDAFSVYDVPAPFMSGNIDRILYVWGHGAKSRQLLTIPNDLYGKIMVVFAGENDERMKIAEAMALLEGYCAMRTNTTGDEPSIGLFRDQTMQLDCVDEAFNSTSFCLWLWAHKFIKHHRVEAPSWKQPSIFSMPHYGGRIVDCKTGVVYAIDSGVSPPGGKPLITPWEKFYTGR